jgi:hypothetical protein
LHKFKRFNFKKWRDFEKKNSFSFRLGQNLSIMRVSLTHISTVICSFSAAVFYRDLHFKKKKSFVELKH